MKNILLTLTLFLCYQNMFAQAIDSNNPAIVKLQTKYNEAIKISINNEKLPWASAIVMSDAAVNHILDSDFNAAERYVRELDKKATMIEIDSAIQLTMIFNAFLSAPDLVNVQIQDRNALITALQDGRRKMKFKRISMEMTGICTGSSIVFASYLINRQVSGLNIFFDNLKTFKTIQPALERLSASISKSAPKFKSFPGKGADSDKLICTFFNTSGDLAQLKLSYKRGDYFGKIQNVEFVAKGKFQKEQDDGVKIEILH